MAINIPEILVANGAGMILMLLILFYSHRTFRIGLPDEKMFYGIVVASCFLCVMTAGETAIGFGIIGGLSVLAWEVAIKPFGKKALAAGKAALQKAKEKKAGKFEKKAEETEDLVEVDEN